MEEEPPTAAVSINALTGGLASGAMEFTGKIFNHPTHILLDSGSTHNFLAQPLAHQLHLPIQPTPHLRVLVASGESVPCAGRALQVPLQLGPTHFKVDFLILPLLQF